MAVTYVMDIVNTVHVVVKRFYAYGPLDIFKIVTQWKLSLESSLKLNNAAQT
jgi:hypothetical protein